MTRYPSNFFFKLCQDVAAEVPAWTQGAGGNISEKSADQIWIKATGRRLDEVRPDLGLALVNRSAFMDWLQNDRLQGHSEEEYAGALKQFADSAFERPSMETAFHGILPSRFVAHFHPLSSVIMADLFFKKDRRFDFSKYPVAFVPVELPGLRLARRLWNFSERRIIVMQNHGVILQGENEDLLASWKSFEQDFLSSFGIQFDLSKESFLSASFKHQYLFPDSAAFAERLARVLVAEGDLVRIEPGSEAQDKNAFEIAWATYALVTAWPSIGGLDTSYIEQVSGLPTEKIRLKV